MPEWRYLCNCRLLCLRIFQLISLLQCVSTTFLLVHRKRDKKAAQDNDNNQLRRVGGKSLPIFYWFSLQSKPYPEKKWAHNPGRQIVSVIWLHTKHGFLNTGLINSAVTIMPLVCLWLWFQRSSRDKEWMKKIGLFRFVFLSVETLMSKVQAPTPYSLTVCRLCRLATDTAFDAVSCE